MLGFLGRVYRRLVPERIQVWCVNCKSRQQVQVVRYTPPPKARMIGRCGTCKSTTSTFTPAPP
jgi:hypothetical protein